MSRTPLQSVFDRTLSFLGANPMLDDIFPKAKNAEEAVLGALLHEPKTVSALLQIHGITKDYFYEPACNCILGECMELMANGVEPDFITVLTRLRDTKKEEAIGGAAYLNNLMKDAGVASMMPHYLRILIDKYASRRIITDCLAMAARVSARQDEPGILNDAQKMAVGFTAIGVRADDSNIVEQITKLRTKRKDTAGKAILGLGTHLPALDLYTGGVCPGHLVAIGGMGKRGKSRGSGKTSYATDIFRHVLLEHEKPAIFLQMEMDAEQMLYRIVSGFTGIPIQYILQKRVTDEQETCIQGWLDWLATSHAKLDCTGRLSLSQVCAKLRAFKAMNPEAVLGVIDYFQLIQYRGGKDWNMAQVSKEKSETLKGLARELNMCLVVLTQLNAKGDTAEGVTLENDSDRVEKIDHAEDGCYVEITKNRHGDDGSTGEAIRIPVEHDRECVRFLPIPVKS